MISQREADAMRGVAILVIFLHNFLHHVLPTVENEFDFSLLRVEGFVQSLEHNPLWAMADILSFVGWYGVVVFIFLSGYGLVRKFEGEDNPRLGVWSFVRSRWFKVFKLMLLPMLIFAVVWSAFMGKLFPLEQLAQQLLLVGNVAFPHALQPGVYWFFGLIFQLYIFYRLCLYRRSTTWIIMLNILCLALLVGLWLYGDVNIFSWMRHNFFGWILPFSLGVLFARYDFGVLFANRGVNLAVVLFSGPLLVAMNYDPYLWLLSPVVAIVAAVSLAKIWQGGVWLGGLSSFIFVIHPIVRFVLLRPQVREFFGYEATTPYTTLLLPRLALYVALTLLFAVLYRRLYRRIF
jgi:hypothetical protein